MVSRHRAWSRLAQQKSCICEVDLNGCGPSAVLHGKQGATITNAGASGRQGEQPKPYVSRNTLVVLSVVFWVYGNGVCMFLS